MKAIILAGGLGTRLKPFTQIIPKPLLPVGESSVLEIQILSLKKHGVTDIFIATNYMADYVQAFLGDGSKYGVRLVFSKEQQPLGTCGPVTLLEKEFNEPFFLMNGDILTTLDFGKAYAFACQHQAQLVVLTKEIRTPFSFGKVVSQDDCLIGLEEKPNFRFEILSGIYVLKPSLFSLIPKNTYYGIDTLIKDMLAANMKVGKYLMPEYWLDIGQIEDFEQAQEVYKTHFEHFEIRARQGLISLNLEYFMDYDIPLFALNYGPEEEEAVLATLRSKWISMGPRTAQLEKVFAEMNGSPHAVAVTNCTAALHMAMEIVGVGSNDEVIVPSLTFVATVNAVRYVGAKPVFCDVVGAGDLNMDPRQVENLITPRTRAITVMHYGGFPCDMDAIMAVAKKHGLAVVEDACHGPLSEYRGRKLGTLGDIGCFSFFSNKNISTGEGGIMLMTSREHFEKAKLMRSHGMTSLSYERAKGHAVAYDVVAPGYNYRMDDIRASLALVQLDRLQADLEKRARIRDQYLRRLRELVEVIVPFASHTGFVSNYIFPIVLRNADATVREAVRVQLHSRGIQTSIHYPPAHRFSIYRNSAVSLPQTEAVSDSEISLPMHGSLKMEEVDRVVNALKEGIWIALKK